MFSCKVIKGSYCLVKASKSAGVYSEVRLFSRWASRRPLKVLTHEEFEENETPAPRQKKRIKVNSEEEYETESRSVKIRWKHAEQDVPSAEPEAARKPRQIKPGKQKQASFDMLQTIIDANGDFVYTKMGNNDRRISSLLTTVKSRKHKEEKNLILLEGKRLIKEALQNKCKLQHLLFSRKDDLEYFKNDLPKSGANLFKMPYREMQMWSDLTVCPGVMGVFMQPDVENAALAEDSLPVTVVCDNVREPGNMGSILRTCAGAGCRKVILTKGCVNVWDTKVTRSGSGAHFHLQIQSKLDWPQIAETLDKNCKVFLADNTIIGTANEFGSTAPVIPYYSTNFNKCESIVLILGGETDGLSEEAYKCARGYNGVRLNVPLMNGVDSLNSGVALGVIIFEIKKQLVTRNTL